MKVLLALALLAAFGVSGLPLKTVAREPLPGPANRFDYSVERAGNVQYDAGSHMMVAVVQTRDVVAVIDPKANRVDRDVSLPGCDHDHGLLVDAPRRLTFVACDGNAKLLTLDLRTWKVTGSDDVGDDPDVLPSTRRFGACTSPPRAVWWRSSTSADARS
jgi:hypothetical protein